MLCTKCFTIDSEGSNACLYLEIRRYAEVDEVSKT